MNRDSYLVIQRLLREHVDEKTLNEASDLHLPPFLKSQVSHWVKNRNVKEPPAWDNTYIRKDLESTDVDKTIAMFFQFIGRHVLYEKIKHRWLAPYSDHYDQWKSVFKWLIVCVVTLVWKIEWNTERHATVENSVEVFCRDGRPHVLRQLLLDLGVSREVPISGFERSFFEPVLNTPYHWGPLFWRVLHLVAESCVVSGEVASSAKSDQADILLAKREWRGFLTHFFHRFLLCVYCSQHYVSIAGKYNLTEGSDEEFVQKLFELHNEVNQSLGKPVLTDEKWRDHRSEMRRLLTAHVLGG